MSKILGGFVVLLAFAVYFGTRENARFNALPPAAQYEERCKQDAMASAMAASRLRQHLNIVDTPKFEEWGLQRYVKPSRNTANDCLFTVEGHITFKNENGGQSRRMARVVLGPKRGDNDSWLIFSVDVW
jgi:hypothetical protein